MQLINNYWVFKKAFSKANCDKIIKAGLEQPKTKGLVSKAELKLKARNCYVSFVSQDWIYALLNPYIHMANKNANWNFQWDWNEPVQFTAYTKNQFYGWHADKSNEPYAADLENINMRNKIRKLSLTLQLTEPSEYEGGNFEFKWFDSNYKNGIRKVLVKEARELGSLIIFPSFMWHRITPIAKGKRQSLVNWSVGKPFI